MSFHVCIKQTHVLLHPTMLGVSAESLVTLIDNLDVILQALEM